MSATCASFQQPLASLLDFSRVQHSQAAFRRRCRRLTVFTATVGLRRAIRTFGWKSSMFGSLYTAYFRVFLGRCEPFCGLVMACAGFSSMQALKRARTARGGVPPYIFPLCIKKCIDNITASGGVPSFIFPLWHKKISDNITASGGVRGFVFCCA